MAETVADKTFLRSAPILYSDVRITNSQMLALAANPITLVSAPGANKTIIVERVHLHFDVTTTGYTEPSAPDNLIIAYNTGQVIVEVDATGFLDQTSDQTRNVTPSYAGGAAAAGQTPVANVSVFAQNNSNEWTGGNAANTLSIRTYYRIEPTVVFGAA